jgi:hypothetical protein
VINSLQRHSHKIKLLLNIVVNVSTRFDSTLVDCLLHTQMAKEKKIVSQRFCVHYIDCERFLANGVEA